MRTALPAALVAAFLLAGCQTATEASPAVTQAECPQYMIPAEPLVSEWKANGVVFQLQEGAIRSAIVAEVNNQKPPTNWDPSEVYVARCGTMAALVFVFDDGCLWTTGPVPQRNLDAVLRRLRDGAA